MVISAERSGDVIGGVVSWRSFGVKDTCIFSGDWGMMQASAKACSLASWNVYAFLALVVRVQVYMYR